MSLNIPIHAANCCTKLLVAQKYLYLFYIVHTHTHTHQTGAHLTPHLIQGMQNYWVPGCLGGYIWYCSQVLSVALATNHSSGTYNFEVAPRFLEN